MPKVKKFNYLEGDSSLRRKNMETIQELLEMAIRAEIDSENIYSDLSKMVKNYLLKEKLEFLAKEENGHKKMLEHIFSMKYPNKEPEIPDSTKVPLPHIVIKEKEPLSDIFTQAMDAEEKTSKFYTDLSKRMKGEESNILSYMSNVEMSHYYLLKSERELLLNFENYDQYSEMMHIGP